MKRKIFMTISILSLVGIVLIATGCLKENAQANNDTKNNKEVTKENAKFGKDEEKVLAGNVIEYKFDEKGKSGKVGELDLDLDGEKDEISLGELVEKEDQLETLEIKVNNSKVKFRDYRIQQVVTAVAFDNKHILLASHAQGMNADEDWTRFYMYSNNKLELVGELDNDLREILNNGVIPFDKNTNILSSIENEGALSDSVIVKYKWNGLKLKKVNEPVDYVNQNEKIKVIKELVLYKDYSKKSKSIIVKPSIIYPIKMYYVDGIYWSYIKTEDGQEGWIDSSVDAFENLNVSD